MPPYAFTIRFSPAQTQLLEQLSAQLGIDKTNVIRIAITRLAQAEGVLRSNQGDGKLA